MASRELLGFKHRNSYTVESPAPINYVMGRNVYGSYDGLKLHPPDSTWKAYPANQPINKLLSNPMFVPQHGGGPLKNEVVPVDIPYDSMFMFAHNQASPYCSSNFSTSTGQVCTTPYQRNLIGQYRGNNKCGPTNPQCSHSNPDF